MGGHVPPKSSVTLVRNTHAASDDIVPHLHTDELVAKLGQLHLDEIIPDSDHLNIPYLPATQARIASFLSAQFEQVPASGEPAAN